MNKLSQPLQLRNYGTLYSHDAIKTRDLQVSKKKFNGCNRYPDNINIGYVLKVILCL